MTPRRRSKARKRHSQASLDALVHVLVLMSNKMIEELPFDQQAQVIDGVLQHMVQALNRWHDMERDGRQGRSWR